MTTPHQDGPRDADDVYNDMTMEIGIAKALINLMLGAIEDKDASFAAYAARGHLEKALEFSAELWKRLPPMADGGQ